MEIEFAACSTALDSLYKVKASSSVSAPLATSSTSIDCETVFTSLGCEKVYFFRWCLMVAFNRKGLDETPNTTHVNLKTWIHGWVLVTSSNHRNCRTSWLHSSTQICRNARSISAVSAVLDVRNLNKMSMILWLNLGPVYRQSFTEEPVVMADAS